MHKDFARIQDTWETVLEIHPELMCVNCGKEKTCFAIFNPNISKPGTYLIAPICVTCSEQAKETVDDLFPE